MVSPTMHVSVYSHQTGACIAAPHSGITEHNIAAVPDASNGETAGQRVKDSAPSASMVAKTDASTKGRIIWFCKVFIPLILFIPFAIPVIKLDEDNDNVSRAAGLAILMAGWWVFEPVPLAVTALLPALLIPLLGIDSANKASAAYFNNIQFLFLGMYMDRFLLSICVMHYTRSIHVPGGFVLGEALEYWNLQKRISLKVLSITGLKPRLNLLGMMMVTFFLSMFMSNTATAVACIPNGIALVKKIEEIVRSIISMMINHTNLSFL